MPEPLTVRRSPFFEQQCRRLLDESLGRPDLVDLALEGFEWVVSRRPEYGVRIPDSDLRALPFLPGDKTHLIYYRIRENEAIVELVGLKLASVR